MPESTHWDRPLESPGLRAETPVPKPLLAQPAASTWGAVRKPHCPLKLLQVAGPCAWKVGLGVPGSPEQPRAAMGSSRTPGSLSDSARQLSPSQ